MHEIVCRHCGRGHNLTSEKLRQFVGKAARCTCGHTFLIESPAPVGPEPETSDDEMFDAIMSGPTQEPEPLKRLTPPADDVGFVPSAHAFADEQPTSRRLPPIDYRRPSRVKSNGFRDFFEFRRMITVSIVQWLFLLGSMGLILSALYATYQAMTSRMGFERRIEMMGTAFLTAIIGIVVLRLVCEFVVVVFRINETLTEIKNNRME